MRDSADEEIRVGSRVTEVDFGYGDGIVESIEVPVQGGGFNVGVMWDDPGLGGPTWSAEGGGRGANHLLVVEAAAASAEALEAAFGGPDDGDFAYLWRGFKARFGRSPTRSEAELSEGDWDEIEGCGEEAGEGGEHRFQT